MPPAATRTPTRRNLPSVDDLRHMDLETTEDLAAWVNANRMVLHQHSLEIVRQAGEVHEAAVFLRKRLLKKMRHGGHKELGVRRTIGHNREVRLIMRPLFTATRDIAEAGDRVQMSGGRLVRWYHMYLLEFHQLVTPARGEKTT
jgi:hypothetical protein